MIVAEQRGTKSTNHVDSAYRHAKSRTAQPVAYCRVEIHIQQHFVQRCREIRTYRIEVIRGLKPLLELLQERPRVVGAFLICVLVSGFLTALLAVPREMNSAALQIWPSRRSTRLR